MILSCFPLPVHSSLPQSSTIQALRAAVRAWYRVSVPSGDSLEAPQCCQQGGKPYQVFCLDDRLSIPGSKPICLYQNKWHALLENKKEILAVGLALPEVHKYDINTPTTALDEALEEEPPSSLKEPPPAKTPTLPSTSEATVHSQTQDQQLRLLPIPTEICTSPIISPIMTLQPLRSHQASPYYSQPDQPHHQAHHPLADQTLQPPPVMEEAKEGAAEEEVEVEEEVEEEDPHSGYHSQAWEW